jgi:hypothetical protein
VYEEGMRRRKSCGLEKKRKGEVAARRRLRGENGLAFGR